MNEFDLYKSGLSLPKVSKKTGIPISTLRFRFNAVGILRDRGVAVRMAYSNPDYVNPMKGRVRGPMPEETKSKLSNAMLGRGRGWRVNTHGYIEFTAGPNKGRVEHVVVMEQSIGRHLLPHEVVHHRNRIRVDNRLSNLQLMTRSGHTRHHALERIAKGIPSYDISKHSLSGENHRKAILSIIQVKEIRSLKGTMTYSEIAVKYSVSTSCIKHVMKNRNWKNL